MSGRKPGQDTAQGPQARALHSWEAEGGAGAQARTLHSWEAGGGVVRSYSVDSELPLLLSRPCCLSFRTDTFAGSVPYMARGCQSIVHANPYSSGDFQSCLRRVSTLIVSESGSGDSESIKKLVGNRKLLNLQMDNIECHQL